jgi:hypothetical protein
MRWVLGLAIGLAMEAVVVQPAAAQSTIFNIPTTDTVAPKKYYFEFDYLLQLPKPDFGQFSVVVPRAVVGITPMLEAGVNVGFYSVADGGGTTTIFQPNVKYKFFSDDDMGLAAAAGVIGYMANNDADSFGQIYANVSKKLKNGARVHGGIYGALSCDACDGAANKVGAIAGYEQPISGKASFVVDLLTGNNFWGYLTPGVSLTLPRSGLLNIGYSIGWNEIIGDGIPDYKNNALFVYYGITLP